MSRRAIRCPECDAPQPNPVLRRDGRIACRDCGLRFNTSARERADIEYANAGEFPWRPVLAGVGVLVLVVSVAVAYWAFSRQPDPRIADAASPGDRPESRSPAPKRAAPGPKPSDGKPLVTFPAKVFELAPVAASVEVPLSGVPDDACVGGGGRFVIYRIPKRKQLAVLDVCLAKVVKAIPTADEKSPFAAGMTKSVTYSPSRNEFERWDLETLTKEATVNNRVSGRPERLLMGHRTDGPSYVGGQKVGQDDCGTRSFARTRSTR